MSADTVTYRHGETALAGVIARPQGTPRAAVLLFPSIMNQKPNAHRRLPMLTDAGYLALMADFYGEDPQSREDAFRLGDELRRDVAHYRQRIATAVEWAAGLADGLPLAAIGYCMGGQAVLEAARMNLPLAAVVSFHGILSSDAPASEPIAPRILVCHGDKDPLVPRSQVTGFEEEMDRARADWHLHVYSNAKHGFTDPESDSHGMPAIGYDASADRQSWAAMLSLFDEMFA
ncbi:MAG: dienelactone hydrolase family protein [Tsuneonella sp.]